MTTLVMYKPRFCVGVPVPESPVPESHIPESHIPESATIPRTTPTISRTRKIFLS